MNPLGLFGFFLSNFCLRKYFNVPVFPAVPESSSGLRRAMWGSWQQVLSALLSFAEHRLSPAMSFGNRGTGTLVPGVHLLRHMLDLALSNLASHFFFSVLLLSPKQERIHLLFK